MFVNMDRHVQFPMTARPKRFEDGMGSAGSSPKVVATFVKQWLRLSHVAIYKTL